MSLMSCRETKLKGGKGSNDDGTKEKRSCGKLTALVPSGTEENAQTARASTLLFVCRKRLSPLPSV